MLIDMNDNYVPTALVIVASLILFSCDMGSVLDKSSPLEQDPEEFFSDESGAVAAINAVYATAQSDNIYDEELLNVLGASTDDWFLNNTWGITLNNYTFNPEEAAGGRLDQSWQGLYEGIFRANLVINRVPEIDMNQSLKDRILGEARFFRGFYYWHLANLWGDVPITTEANPNDPSAAEIGKSPVGEVYNQVFEDLETAADLLPRKSEYSSSEIGRVTQGAAHAMLGKAHLYNENWEDAENYFDMIIQSGEYRLLDSFNDALKIDNNDESIFEIQYDAGRLGGEGQSQFGYPNGHGGFSNYLVRQDAVDEFEGFDGESSINGRDPRLFYSIWRDGDPWDPPREPEYKEEWVPSPGYIPKKQGGSAQYPLPSNFLTESPSRNRKIIRYSDVLLMNAEAANELNKPDKAINLLNQVRDRVGMPNHPTSEYPVGNKQEIFEAIVHERRVELMFEFNRLYDLRRWGLAEEELGPLGYEAPRHRYFPIPQSELDANSELEQNPNY